MLKMPNLHFIKRLKVTEKSSSLAVLAELRVFQTTV